MPYAGGCSCGAVHYELTAEPIRGFQCQCRDCQRDTGSGHASVMVFPRAALRITGPVAEISRTADTGAQKAVIFASRGHAWDHLDPALPKVPNMRPSP